MDAQTLRFINYALKNLNEIKRCGCFNEPPGEGLDPDHATSILRAINALNAAKREAR